MKNRLILSLLVISGSAFGQQEFQFTQLASQPYLLNPAAGGMMDVAEVVIGNRLQYAGIDGKPMTSYASIQSRLRLKKRKNQVLGELGTAGQTFYSTPQRTIGYKQVGGFTFVNDVIGPFSRNNIKLNYGAHIPIAKNLNAGVGIGVGYSNFGINQSRVKLSTEQDKAYDSYVAQTASAHFLDAQAGIVLYNDQLLVSLSGSQLFNNKARFNGEKSESNFAPHLSFLAAYRFGLGKTISLEPQFQLRYINHTPLSFDIAARVHYKRMGWMSVSYRRQSAIGVGVGINLLARFNVAYTYEFGTGITQKFGANTHEIRLGFLFGKKTKQEPTQEYPPLQQEDVNDHNPEEYSDSILNSIPN